MNTLNLTTTDEFLDEKYDIVKNHTTDSGFDLYCPEDIVVPANAISFKIDMKVQSRMDFDSKNVGFMMTPRSSMGSKTPLRLCNSIGIIDAGYTGNLMGFVDNRSSEDYSIRRGDRLLQVVAFNGLPIVGNLVGELVTTTERGDGGFGSTGK